MEGYADFKFDLDLVIGTMTRSGLFSDDARFRRLISVSPSSHLAGESVLASLETLRYSFDITSGAIFFTALHQLVERLARMPDQTVAELAESLYALGFYSAEVRQGNRVYPPPPSLPHTHELDVSNPGVFASLAEEVAWIHRYVVCEGMIPRPIRDNPEAYLQGMDLHMTSSSLNLATKGVIDCVTDALRRTPEGRDVLSRGRPIPPRDRNPPNSTPPRPATIKA
jgi:hypothetical protein